MHANQIQLTSLNEIVQRLSTEAGSQRDLLSGVSAQVTAPQLASLEATIAEQQARLAALSANVTKLEQENRLLKVGHGATFEELAASGKALTGRPIDLRICCLSARLQETAPSVPPLVHIHVPKAAGTTLNNILMRNYRYRADSYGTDFFPRYFPGEFRLAR